MNAEQKKRSDKLTRWYGDSQFVRSLLPHGQIATRILHALGSDPGMTDAAWQAFFAKQHRSAILKRKNMGRLGIAVLDATIEALGWRYADPVPKKRTAAPGPPRPRRHHCPKCGHSW